MKNMKKKKKRKKNVYVLTPLASFHFSWQFLIGVHGIIIKYIIKYRTVQGYIACLVLVVIINIKYFGIYIFPVIICIRILSF